MPPKQTSITRQFSTENGRKARLFFWYFGLRIWGSCNCWRFRMYTYALSQGTGHLRVISRWTFDLCSHYRSSLVPRTHCIAPSSIFECVIEKKCVQQSAESSCGLSDQQTEGCCVGVRGSLLGPLPHRDVTPKLPYGGREMAELSDASKGLKDA